MTEVVRGMTELEIKRVQKLCKEIATKAGYPQEAEDFAQEVLIRRAFGRKGKLIHMWIDYLRQNYGAIRPGQDTSKANFLHSLIQLESWHEKAFASADELEVKELFSLLPPGIDRAIACLNFYYEFNGTEIAEVFGVTPSAVCLRLKPIREMLMKKIKGAVR